MDALYEERPWTDKLRSVFWVVLILGVAATVILFLRGEKLVIRNPEAYQAVFLDNGQVYFGKLRPLNRDFFSLSDIYYLRAGAVQQGGPNQAVNSVDLIKLGSELHAPRDEMIIQKDHLVFYEDIGPDSEVTKLIKKHKSGK